MSVYRGDAFLILKCMPGRDAAERPVLVFQCYLDDSGTSGMPIVTMAGFAAHHQRWEMMESKFDAILNRHGVPVLHAKQFHDTDGYFKKWSKLRKRSFTDELFGSAHGMMKGYSVAVRREEFYSEKNRSGHFQTMSPIGVSFSAIMMAVVLEPDLGPQVRQHGLSFLIESGNKNNAELEKAFHNYSNFGEFKNFLKTITFLAKNSCRAIQVADFFAFYSRRQLRNNDRFSGKLVLPACAYMEIIKKHVPIMQRVAHVNADKQVGNMQTINLDELSASARRR